MRVGKFFRCLGFAILRDNLFFKCLDVVVQGCSIPVLFISEAVCMAIVLCLNMIHPRCCLILSLSLIMVCET